MRRYDRLVGYVLLFAFVVFLAAVKGLRMPSLWSLNYYLPDIFDGFVRRGLAGTLLYPLGDARFSYHTVAAVQFGVLAILLGWFLSLYLKDATARLVITAFFVSANGAFFFHEVGYIEQLLALVLFVAIMLYPRYRFAAMGLMGTSVWLHEMALFFSVPLFAYFVMLHTQSIRHAFVASIPSLVFFGVIFMGFQTLPEESVRAFMKQISTHADYPFRYDYYGVFVHSFIGKRFAFHYNLNCILPFVLTLGVVAATSLLAADITQKRLTGIGLATVSMAPLLLGFFGYDLNRWFFLSFSALAISVVLLSREGYVNASAWLHSRYAYAAITAWTIYIGTMFYDFFEWQHPRPLNLNGLFEMLQSLGTIPKL